MMSFFYFVTGCSTTIKHLLRRTLLRSVNLFTIIQSSSGYTS
jgi:hypothetical protein